MSRYKELGNLSIAHHARYNQTQRAKDLAEALDLHAQVLTLLPPGEHIRASLEALASGVTEVNGPIARNIDYLIIGVRCFRFFASNF